MTQSELNLVLPVNQQLVLKIVFEIDAYLSTVEASSYDVYWAFVHDYLRFSITDLITPAEYDAIVLLVPNYEGK